MAQLKISEMFEHSGTDSFSGAPIEHKDGTCGWCLSWIQHRGRMAPGSTDGGADLYLYNKHCDPSASNDDFPEAVLTSIGSLSSAVWQVTEDPSADPLFIIAAGQQLLQGSALCSAPLPCWVQLPPETHFAHIAPVWCAAGALFVVQDSSGSSLWLAEPSGAEQSSHQLDLVDCRRLWKASTGQNILSFDGSLDGRSVVLVQQMEEGLIGRVMHLDIAQPVVDSRCIAVDGRVDYCTPQVGFTASGLVLCRLNLATSESLTDPQPVVTGMWLVDPRADSAPLPVHVVPDTEHGRYDVKSGSMLDSAGDFVFNPSRTVAAVTTRLHSYQLSQDRLFILDLDRNREACGGALVPSVLGSETGDGRNGCYSAVSLRGTLESSALLFTFRDPLENGDLYTCDHSAPLGVESLSYSRHGAVRRLTRTMPRDLSAKLVQPEQHVIETVPADAENKTQQCHALIYRPESDIAALSQPLLWLHSGPMTSVALEPNTVASWLCKQGYTVCALNFRGSTGFGVAHMDALFGRAGEADLTDCVAAAGYLKQLAGDPDWKIDISRGVGVTGFSWGGYLTLMCMTATAAGTFSCGACIASELVVRRCCRSGNVVDCGLGSAPTPHGRFPLVVHFLTA